MKVKDQRVGAMVDVLDKDCLNLKCCWPRPDPRSFVQGRGYRHRSDGWLCGTREIRGCPEKKDRQKEGRG